MAIFRATEALIEISTGSTRRAWWMCSPDVMEQFTRYSWPGNVRELRNVLERAVILAGEGTITAHHLPRDFGVPAGARAAQQVVEPDGVRLPVGTTVGEAEKSLSNSRCTTPRTTRRARPRFWESA